MSKAKRITVAMRKRLEDFARTGNAYHRVHGMSAHGGAARTMWALRQRGLMEYDTDGFLRMTEAGRQAIAPATPATA